MLKNNLRLTWRTLKRQPVFSTINILGLALGIASALCLFEFVGYEWSFDRQVAELDHKYRVYNDRFQHEIGQTNHGQMVNTLLGIGIFILLIAWINYVNLTTARSLDRAMEVGIRKVLGAHRKQIIRQLLAESLVFNALGMLLAITLVQIVQPFLNQWIQRPLSLEYLLLPQSSIQVTTLLMLAGIWIMGIAVSAMYPAWVLSGYRPVAVLKGKFLRGKNGGMQRKGLVTFQLDQRFAEAYRDDIRFGQLMGLFSFLAMFIACLGLFGLSAFNMKLRTKEMGIRKVLGATAHQLIYLLSKEYMWLILLASTLALPISYLLLREWLTGYAHTFTPGISLFLLPVCLLILLGLLTISAQTLRTAHTHPIDALRNE